jgi:hypothetical protein
MCSESHQWTAFAFALPLVLNQGTYYSLYRIISLFDPGREGGNELSIILSPFMVRCYLHIFKDNVI